MKRAALILLLCATAAQAQMYKWKDENGKIHFTDTPPPANAKQAVAKNYGGEAPAATGDAARDFPVTLWTTPDCDGCNQGRALLNKRGIPFREKTVTTNEDIAALNAAGSTGGQAPLLVVGRNRQVGFETSTWQSMLTEAGYPVLSTRPPGYKNPPPTPATVPAPTQEELAKAAQDAANAAAAEEMARRDRATPKNAPPNFRF